MVRFSVWTCVLGMAACCLAVIIRPSISYAQSNSSCPCWPGGLSQLETEIGPPASTDLSHCDNILRTNSGYPSPHYSYESRSAGIYASDTSIDALAAISSSVSSGRLSYRLKCQYKDRILEHNTEYGEPSDPSINNASIESCMEDLLAYCREYCKDNPNAECP